MKRLILCIDGMGKDLVNSNDTPFLYKFGKENFFSELKTLFAFTGIEFCFFTAKTPRESGIWLEFKYDNNSVFNNFYLRNLSFGNKVRNYFGVLIQLANKRSWVSGLHNIPRDKLKYFDTSVRQNLWKLEYFKDKDYVFYKWPFFVTKEDGRENRKIIFNYESDDERLKRLLSYDKEIYYTQLMNIDKTIHKHGKKSKETRFALKEMDNLVNDYVEEFLRKNKKGEVIIWSDHGFADISNYIDIESKLPKKSDYIYFIAGTTVSFWFKNYSIKKEIIDIVNKINGVKVLNEEDSVKYRIPFDRDYGDLIIYLDKGNYFFPNFYQKRISERFVAMHGYPDDKELNGFMISNVMIPSKLRIDEFIKYFSDRD